MKKKLFSLLLLFVFLLTNFATVMAETEDVTNSTAYIYTEDFNDTPDSSLWIRTKGSYDGTHSRTGKSSYMYANGNKLAFSAGQSYTGKVYEVWMYYQKDSSENKQIILNGTNSAGASKKITVFAYHGYSDFRAKVGSGSALKTNLAKSVGWNKIVIDCTDVSATKLYINGTLGYKFSSTDSFSTVTTYTLENGANNSKVWFDDFKIYNKYTDVPVSKSAVIESMLFDSEIAVNGATGVGKYDGNINIKYIKEMSDITADNFALYKKTPSAADNTYVLVENGFSISEDGSVISLTNLEASTKYRLWMNGLECADGTVMDNDFVEFTTAKSLELLTNVVDGISFENGINVPAKGIPSGLCGDLTITLKEVMNTNTLTNTNIILEKITTDGAKNIEYTANASETTYVIDSDSMNLEPSSTYRLTFKTNILTSGRNHLLADEIYEFATSADANKQEPTITDDFETVSDDWTINPTAAENAHSGSYVLLVNSGESAVYTSDFIANGVYEVWFYDTMSSNDSILLQLDGENDETVMFGIKDGVANKYWLSGDSLVGNRSEGWHRFIVDFTNPSQVGYYIGDVLVAERTEAFDKVTSISICNLTSATAMMADDFKIWNLMDCVVIPRVIEAEAFICDENYNSVLEFAEGDEVYIALEVDNQQESSQDAVLLVGEYLGGVLTNVISGSSDTFEPFESAYLKASYTIPENFANYELKAFCWDSILTMKPLMFESNPKDMTVVFLGNDDSYIQGVSEYLTQTYGIVSFINSTIAGKGSEFGSDYFDSYAGSHNPDILFVDYASVDDNNAEMRVKKHVEEIVQKSMGLFKKPKIVFLNKTANAWHDEVAQYYNIPVIDLSQADSASYASVINESLAKDGFLANIAFKESSFSLDSTDIDTDIMSFNIRVSSSSDGDNVWDNRKAAVVDFINNSNADVISMQEVKENQFSYIKENLSDKYGIVYYVRASSDKEGLAVAYNTDMFELVFDEVFWLSETPDVESMGWDAQYHRICVNTLLKNIKTGNVLDIYNVHLDNAGADAQKNGLKLVVERATEKGYNAAVMGDFNFQPTVTDRYNAIANDMTDCMVTAPITESGGTFHAFGTQTNEKPIDYIFVSKENMTPLTFDIVTETWTNSDNEEKYYSDHYPIKLTVKVTYEID